jgi:hypothetical protein
MPLPPTQLQNSAHYRTHYAAVVGADDSLAIVTTPEYWIHVARQLRRMDVIDILPEDESYYAELLVLSTGTGYAKVMVLRHVELAEVEEENAEAQTIVKWNGPHSRWVVIRKSDNFLLQEKLADKPAALAFAAQYERKINA